MSSEQQEARPRGPLEGIKVVELAGIGPAQLGAMMLSDLGADVVRVDRPSDVPDPMPADPSREVLARGRRSIALDLKGDADRELLLRLVERSDVLIDPYRPGVVERLGIGPDVVMARNPAILFARMTGWGQKGPLAHAAGHDINYIALAGALEAIGPADEPPPVPLNLVGDFGGGGMLLAFGITSGLVERARSGQGQVIDVAMVDGVAALMTSVFQLRAMGLWHSGRHENWLQGAAPWYRAYVTGDGRHVTVGTLEPQFYRLLLERLGLDPTAWPQWERVRWPALIAELQTIFAAHPLAHWQHELEGTDVCFAASLDLSELTGHPHLQARSTFVVDDGMLQPAPAPRFERTPGAIAGPPPWPGQHTRELRDELGLAPESQ